MAIGRDFWIFRVGQFISTVGDPFTNIAIAWWVLDETQSASLVSLAIAPSLFGKVIFLPVSGRIADLYSRKKLLLLSDLIRFCSTALIAGIAVEDYFSIVAIAAIGFVSSIGAALHASAEYSILPSLVLKDGDVSIAMQFTEFLSSIGMVIGAALAGIVISVFGVSTAFGIDAITFAIGAFATALLSTAALPQNIRRTDSIRQLLEVKPYFDGFRILVKVPVLLGVSVVSLLMNFFVAPLAVAIPLYVSQSLRGDAWELGLLNAGQGLGNGIGALITGVSIALFARHRTIILGMLLAGISLCILPLMPFLITSFLFMMMFGVASSLANVPLRAQRVVASGDEYRSRIDSAMKFLFGLAAPLGVIAAGPIIEVIGASTGTIMIGLAIMLLTPLLLVIPDYRRFYNSDTEEAQKMFRRMLHGDFSP
ncbi:MAG: MFS transporter [Nitrospira sp.]